MSQYLKKRTEKVEEDDILEQDFESFLNKVIPNTSTKFIP